MFRLVLTIKSVVSISIAVVVIGGIIYFASDRGGSGADTAEVQIKNLEQVVSVTGIVKSSQEIDLVFETSGRVANIFVNVGDQVAAGQRLVSLDASELIAQFNEAEANLEAQRAKLEELKKGTRVEELNILFAKVQSARDSLADSKANFVNSAKDSYTKSDDAIRNKVDQFFDNPGSTNPELSFQPNNAQLGDRLEQARPNIEQLLNQWKAAADTLILNSDLGQHSDLANSNLNLIKLFLDDAALLLNSLTPTSNLSQTNIDKYRTDVSTARTNVNAAIANLASAKEKLNAANSSLFIAERELELKQAGATIEQVSAQEAMVRQAEAKSQLINSQLVKTVLRAPFSGVIAKKDIKIGEVVSSNRPIVSVIGQDEFEIETFIPEADIAKINIGDEAEVTLDAYGNDEFFEAEVVSIDPAETIVEGVSTYKTILALKSANGRIKSGMTANIEILADRKEGVIAVPARAVIYRNGDKILRILVGDTIDERMVETGIRGSDGFIEITGGIEAGEEVIVFIRN